MADESPSTKDLLFLIAGLAKVKQAPANAQTGRDYWLTEPTNKDERKLRESYPNLPWILSPKLAWAEVRFRDWLIATLAQNIADNKHEFIAISEPLIASIDLLGKEFTRDMKGVTQEIQQTLLTKNKKECSVFSTLTAGLSKHDNKGREVYVLGAGMRRRARVFLTESEDIQADVEFLVPFLELQNSEPKIGEFVSSSICAGIALSRSNGNPIGVDEDKSELFAVRFNLRIPFSSRWEPRVKTDEHELKTVFSDAEVRIEKRIRKKRDDDLSAWQKFSGWKDFCKEFLERAEGKELMTAPIGPLIVSKVSDEAGFTDIFIRKSKLKEFKEDLGESAKELKETVKFLGGIQNYTPPEINKVDAPSSVRKLSSMLETLGLLSIKKDEYSVKLVDDLTAWDVVNRILNELDGYPLYIKGVTAQNDKEARIALGLATVETEAKNKFFGLGGAAYNIPLKVVSEKDPKTEKEEKDPETPTIVVSEDNFTEDTGSLIAEEDEQEDLEGSGPEAEPEPKPEPGPEPKPEKKGKQSTVEVFLHLGKWLSGETIDDNWLRRLMPLGENKKPTRTPVPGIRVMPIKRVHTDNLKNQEATFSWSLLFDLVSLGIDIKGATKAGLGFLEGWLGHFGLGAFEVRLALKISLDDFKTEKNFFERVSIGIGVKLKDLRLSFAPREKKKEESDELLGGLQELLKDDWVAVPAPTPTPEKTVKTRLSAKKKDKFSISVGYLTGSKAGSTGTLDVQLYDEKGNRGKMALIPIDRSALIVYVRQIGIALKGVENIELSKGLPDSAQLSVSITGGIRLPVFELGLIGATFTFQLNNLPHFNFTLDGLDISVKIGPVVISGSFFRAGFEFAGSLTVDFKKASFSAMGFYGNMVLFAMKSDKDIVSDLNRLRVSATLSAKLKENGVTLRAENPVALAYLPRRWEVYNSDNEVFIVVDEDDDLTVLRPDKTFFVYAKLTADAGCGPTFGPIQFTGIAFGYGYNRKVLIPKIEDVAEFPLVQVVMGEGGYQDEDTSLQLHGQLGAPVEDPASVLKDMGEVVVAAKGQQFACAGARFTIAGIVDCFALVIVQWGEEFELSLLGLARFRQPRDLTARALCYIELQILMSLKPKEGTFKLMGLLTSNSWIINTDCKLTGGFALCVWFDGDHKGDIVFTFGGYHPRFRRPEHYPVVPRLGLNWQIDQKLSFKGGIYLALTPSCGMVGGKLEATFHAGRISAWFTVYFDIILNWDPFYYDVEIGISLRVEVGWFFKPIKLALGATVHMWGPPSGGVAHIDLVFVSFDVEFGVPRPTTPELLGSWEKFCNKFLNMSGGDLKAADRPVKAFPIVQPNLAGGASSLNKLPNVRREQQQVKPEDQRWKVRADELEFAASTVVPITSLNVGRVVTNSPPQGVQDRALSGQPMMAPEPVVLEKEGLRTHKADDLGVYPMGKTLKSVLNVTVVHDDGLAQPDLSNWTIELETGSLPAALWDPAKPNPKPSEPSARLMDKCITGVKRLKPPRGTLGPEAPLPQITWQRLDKATVRKETGSQDIPARTRSRDVQTIVVGKKVEQKAIVDALATAGFKLNWEASQSFRELQSEPLAGTVA